MLLVSLGVGLMFLPLLIVVQVDEAMYRRHVAMIFEALRLSDISKEKACEWQGIDKNQWRRQTDEREGHISHTRLLALPLIFWQWFALLLAEEYGIPKCVTRGMRILMVVRNRRQLRMRAEPVSVEQRTA